MCITFSKILDLIRRRAAGGPGEAEEQIWLAIGLFLLVGIAARPALAQERVAVQVSTNWPEAILYADSLRLGPVGGSQVFPVPATTDRIRLVPPGRATWSIQPVSSPVPVAPGDTASLTMDFPYHYRIESIPHGVAVYDRTETGKRRALGQTPLLYKTEHPLQDPLVIDEPGYEIEEIQPGQDIWNEHLIELTPTTDQSERAVVSWEPPTQRRSWIDIAAVGVAAAAAVVSIHYKFKADRLYEEYQQTGDPALRPEIKAYDTRAAVSLGVMQVGFGVFAIRLALR